MLPQFHENGRPVRHPLEVRFNADGWDILSAVEHGFRAQVDVKGKLAEWFLYKDLNELLTSAAIQALTWHDADGKPDFDLTYNGHVLRLECKNVRSGATKFPGQHYVEIQKTRNSIGGGPTRGYKVDEFELLAACLFNQTNDWTYLFTTSVNLNRRSQWPDYLEVYQPVPSCPGGVWKGTLSEAIADLGI